MRKSWAQPDHVGKIVISVLDKLAREFHKEFEKDANEKDFDKLIRLAQSCGYQSQIYSGLQKNHDMAIRIEKVEAFMQDADPEKLAMGNSPVLIAEEDQRSKFAFR